MFTPTSEHYDKSNTTGTNNEVHVHVQVSDDFFFANYEIQHTALQQATNKFYLYQILKVHIWKENEERDLIQLRIEMEEQFNDVKNHDVLWLNYKKKILNSHNIFCDCITSETNGKT